MNVPAISVPEAPVLKAGQELEDVERALGLYRNLMRRRFICDHMAICHDCLEHYQHMERALSARATELRDFIRRNVS